MGSDSKLTLYFLFLAEGKNKKVLQKLRCFGLICFDLRLSEHYKEKKAGMPSLIL